MTRRGLSLVEILIGITLVGVALLPLITLHRGHTVQATHAGSLLRAHTHMMGLLGEAESRLHAARFRSEPTVSGPTSRDVPWGAGVRDVADTVSISPSPHTTGLWEIRVVVTWRDLLAGDAHERQRTAVRLVADPTYEGREP